MKPHEEQLDKMQLIIDTKKEVFDDISETFKLNDNEAIRTYAKCGCCSRFVKKLLEVKKRQLNSRNTEDEQKRS